MRLRDLLLMRSRPWWMFWNPLSGAIGGAIFGALLLIAILALR
jgi:hypothetical protein